jgi:hypothetical protein
MTYHPITPLIRLICHEIRENGNRSIILLSLNLGRQLIHLLDSIRLEQVLVVEMVKEYVQALLRVGDVLFVLSWCLGFHALEVCVEDLVDGARCVGDVRSVAGS